MSNLKQFAVIVAYLIVLIIMVNQSKKDIKKIAEKSVKTDEVVVEVSADTVGEQAPPANSTDVPVPSFNKPKVVKKIKDLDEDFMKMCQEATHDERVKYMNGLVDDIKSMQNKVEWMKQTFALEEQKKTKKSNAIEGQISLTCQYKEEIKTMVVGLEKTIASVRDEFGLAFGIKKVNLRGWTLGLSNNNLCESSRASVASVIKKYNVKNGDVLQFAQYG